MSRLSIEFPPEVVDAIALRTAELLDTRAQTASAGPEPYLSVEEACAYMGHRPKSRLYDLVAEGRLRCRRDGRTVLTKRSWIDEYLANSDGAAS